MDNAEYPSHVRYHPVAQDYTDDVLASYVLGVIILGLNMAGMVCKPHTSKPKPTAIVLEANPMPYVVTRTSPTTQWGRDHTHNMQKI